MPIPRLTWFINLNWSNCLIFYIFVSAALSAKIDLALDNSNLGSSKVEEIAAKNIRNQIVKYVSPVLKTLRDPPDNPEEYKAVYGSLGPYLHQGVVRARQQSGSKSAAATGRDKDGFF